MLHGAVAESCFGGVAEYLCSCHPIAEFAAQLLGCDPSLVALAGFEHLPWTVTVGGNPEGGGVGHGVFDEPGSEHLTVETDFHQGVDQEAPFDMFAGCGSVECHLVLSEDLQERSGPLWALLFLWVITAGRPSLGFSSASAGKGGVGGAEVAFHQGAGAVFVPVGDGVHDEAVVLEASV